MTDPITIRCPDCRASAGDPCSDRNGKSKPMCHAREFIAQRQTVAAPVAVVVTPASAPTPVPAVDDFDETTPPPRRRPIGVPVSREVRLPAGEDLAGIFAQWEREGRVPAGAVLCEFIGLWPFGRGKASGYVLIAGALKGKAGRELTAEEVAPLRVVCNVRRERSAVWHVVLAPKN